MAVALLGPEFDIHGGGMDLKFPHHENEIAQSCAACNAPFARLWMHNGFVRVDDEKMSKSLGNFFTVRDVLPRLRPEVLRAFLLASHYRAPVNYADENLRQADASLQRLYLALRDVEPAPAFTPGDASRDFAAAMDDDFNTPGAIAALQSAARSLNVAKSSGDHDTARALAAELRALGAHIGLLGRAPEEWLATRSGLAVGEEEASGGLDAAAIDAKIAARLEARRQRNFAESDRIRDELAAGGILLEDGPGGTTWRRK
jgi:cysteinyl-tRNA synthetase